jgi:hypothetical protein
MKLLLSLSDTFEDARIFEGKELRRLYGYKEKANEE